MSGVSRKTSYGVGVVCIIAIIFCLYFIKDGMDPVSRNITEYLFTPLWLLTGYFTLRYGILHLSYIWIFDILDRFLSAIVSGLFSLIAIFFAPRTHIKRDEYDNDYNDYEDDDGDRETYEEYPPTGYLSNRSRSKSQSLPRQRPLNIYGDLKGEKIDIFGNRRNEGRDIWNRRYRR